MRHRNLLITGSHTDLGQAIATALALNGATVLLCTHNERLLAGFYDSLVAKNTPEPLLVSINFQQAEIEHFIQLATGLGEAVGTVHGIIHMDIPAAPLSPVSLLKSDNWEVCQRQLLWQPLKLVCAMLPLLQDANHPSVVWHSLACGRIGKAYWGAIGCALAGLENLCQTLADEHPNIRFNTLDVGPVNYNLRRQFYPGEDPSQLKPIDDPLVANGFLSLVSATENIQSGRAYQLIWPE